MLTKTLQIAAICFSMANPSNFNIEQPKKANEDRINFELNLNTELSSVYKEYSYNTNDYQYPTGTARVLKRVLTGANSYLNVFSSSVRETFKYGPDGIYTSIYTNQNDRTNNVLYGIEIAPYSNTINDVFNINFVNTIISYINDNPTTINLITRTYISQDIYWANYLDTSNWGLSQGYAEDVIDAITNPQLGFIYTTSIQSQTLQIGNTNQTVNTDVEIALDPSKTNYIYIWMYTTASYDQTCRLTYPYWFRSETLKVTGTYTPGVTGYEVIDIPGIMWEVLTMPFTFISIAFNLTIFPNTPYQVNLSNLFLSIIGIIIFAWILQKFIRKV